MINESRNNVEFVQNLVRVVAGYKATGKWPSFNKEQCNPFLIFVPQKGNLRH